MKDKAGESNEGFAAVQNLLTRTYIRMMMVKIGGKKEYSGLSSFAESVFANLPTH